MTILDSFFGTTPKRQIEEKAADYQKRVADDYAEREKRAESRKAEVKGLADAADPERRKKFMAADRAAHRAWQFSCTVSGGFIVMRRRDDKEAHAHALNMASVSDIKMTHGKPVRKAESVRYNDHSWEFVSGSAYWTDGWSGYGRPYWTDYFHECRWTSKAEPAKIEFIGPSFVIDRIPHRKANEVYLAIMAAIEAAA